MARTRDRTRPAARAETRLRPRSRPRALIPRDPIQALRVPPNVPSADGCAHRVPSPAIT
jgi:hypothetical protein